jgi:outer membrane protein assembly factor BamA
MTRRLKRSRALEIISGALFLFGGAVSFRSAVSLFRGELLLVLTAAVLCFGCSATLPEGKDAVDAVEISGAPPDTADDILKGLATKPTPGFWGKREFSTLDEAQLARDIERIERELRRRGYYEARVIATRIIFKKERHVRVELEINSGEPIIIRELKTTGLAELPFEPAQAAVQEIEIELNDIFDEDLYEAAKQDVADSLANSGYAYARVGGHAKIDLATHRAEVLISATPGRRCVFGDIKVEGLKDLDEQKIRQLVGIKPGTQYSVEQIRIARATLFDLGVFSRAEVTPTLDDSSQDKIPLTVRVEESTFKDVTVGAGARLDLLRLAVVAQGSWTHRNFFGGLRKFTLSTRPGLTFFPTSIDYLRAPTALFPENFATARLEQPGFIESRTQGFIEAGYNVYPLLYPLPKDTDETKYDPREERVIGYSEITTSVGIERTFFGTILPTTFSLNVQSNTPFNYQGDDSFPGLEAVLVTYPELVNHIDFRDDPIQPTEGVFVRNSIQVAVPLVSGQVSDLRIHPEIRTFYPLDDNHRVILATRAGVGMVLANNYGESEGDYKDPNVVADQHKKLFRAFYSGGPGSNRGYPYRRIGPQGPIGFLIPNDIDCDDPADRDLPTCIRPLGGLTMWEFSTEIRVKTSKEWSFVGFIDASNVSLNALEFKFDAPHISIGPGVRYLSPVGPVRVDVGWRVPGLQKFSSESSENRDIAEVPPYDEQSWWQRFALHILIGEDF